MGNVMGDQWVVNEFVQYNTNTKKIYIAPGILKKIGAQTHGVTRR